MKKIILAVIMVCVTALTGGCGFGGYGPCASCDTINCCGGSGFMGNWY